MKWLFSLMLVASGMAVVCLAERDSDLWSTFDEGITTKTLALSGAPMRVLVDNVDGYVHVTATGGPQVRVTAHKVIKAESEADLQQARNEVRLEMTEQPGSVSVYYDAPWRCNSMSGGCHDQQRRFYNVTYDIDVEMPREGRPVISTVNHGDVRVEGTSGDFDVHNVNGGIAMTGISGSGSVSTVNGPISVRFAKNPSSPSRFKTINGQMDFYFQPHLAADLRFKTFNGQVFSDFEVKPVWIKAAHEERQGTKFVYHSDGLQGGQAGSGGPELSFDTLNGNIRLHEGQRGAGADE